VEGLLDQLDQCVGSRGIALRLVCSCERHVSQDQDGAVARLPASGDAFVQVVRGHV
jgi:hypothetical protein